MEEVTPAVKKTTRVRKTVTQSLPTSTEIVVPSTTLAQVFDDLISRILQGKQEYDNLQKEIDQVNMDWAREQKQHETDLVQLINKNTTALLGKMFLQKVLT